MIWLIDETFSDNECDAFNDRDRSDKGCDALTRFDRDRTFQVPGGSETLPLSGLCFA